RGGSSGTQVRARIVGDRLQVVVESEQPWPDGTTARARVAGPDLVGADVQLERVSATRFVGEVPATRPGSYAVGVSVAIPGGGGFSATATANQSYSPEYRPGPTASAALSRLSRLAGGRGAIGPAQSFDVRGLPAGHGRVPLAGWLLLAAALLWPVDVALRRLALHGTAGA